MQAAALESEFPQTGPYSNLLPLARFSDYNDAL